jgi:hypothetical protein
MEADWEFELGPDAAGKAAPVIDAAWAGFVDLRSEPERAWELPEAGQFSAMAEALIKLNAIDSPVWTSKCDFWPRLEEGEFDPDEMAAPPGYATHAMGCYIDLLPRDDQRWILPESAADECRNACRLLRAVLLGCCRVDLVIRRAIVAPDAECLGVTAYLTSCGETTAEAAKTLQAALMVLPGAFGAAQR